MVRFNFAKVLCKPDRVAFVNQINSVYEISLTGIAVYIYIKLGTKKILMNFGNCPIHCDSSLRNFANWIDLVYEGHSVWFTKYLSEIESHHLGYEPKYEIPKSGLRNIYFVNQILEANTNSKIWFTKAITKWISLIEIIIS